MNSLDSMSINKINAWSEPVKNKTATIFFWQLIARQHPKSQILALLEENTCYFSLCVCPVCLQHYPDERHGGPERHSRDSWGGYGSDRRISEGRGIPPQTRWVPGSSGNLLGALSTSSGKPWKGDSSKQLDKCESSLQVFERLEEKGIATCSSHVPWESETVVRNELLSSCLWFSFK